MLLPRGLRVGEVLADQPEVEPDRRERVPHLVGKASEEAGELFEQLIPTAALRLVPRHGSLCPGR